MNTLSDWNIFVKLYWPAENIDILDKQMNRENNQLQKDPVEDVVKHIHIVIPIVGAVLSFMLTFIAITVA